ncbi:MAG: DUF6580 family putative transport protein [Methanomassiliicoccales archaeon]
MKTQLTSISRLWQLPFAIALVTAFVALALSVLPTLDFIIHINITLYYSAISFAVAGLLVLSIIMRFEGKEAGVKELAVIGAITALSSVSRLVIPIPNVKPCTFLILATGYVFGAEEGIMVGILTPAVSNLFLGQGPWTVWQMLMWSLAGWSGSWLKKHYPSISIESFAAFNFIWGFAFGTPLDFMTWITATNNTTLLPAYLIAGIPWNLADAIGNLFFSLAIGKQTIWILQRYRMRFTTEFV